MSFKVIRVHLREVGAVSQFMQIRGGSLQFQKISVVGCIGQFSSSMTFLMCRDPTARNPFRSPLPNGPKPKGVRPLFVNLINHLYSLKHFPSPLHLISFHLLSSLLSTCSPSPHRQAQDLQGSRAHSKALRALKTSPHLLHHLLPHSRFQVSNTFPIVMQFHCFSLGPCIHGLDVFFFFFGM